MWILCFLLLASVASGDRWDIFNAVTSVPFGDSRIPVWHDPDNDRFLTMPLVMLLNDSAQVLENSFTNKTELTFGILMWTAETQEMVYRHLKANNVHSNISADQVQPLPIEKVRLTWPEKDQPSTDYRLVSEWRHNVHLPSVVNFKIICSTVQKCATLRESLKSTPAMFDGLEVQYLVSGTGGHVVKIAGRHLSMGTVYAKLTTMTVRSGLRYVTSEDADVIASQAVLAALSEAVPDYVDTGEVEILTNALRRRLKLHPVSSTNFLSETWNLVFWEPPSSRPDRLSRYLNSALRADPNDTRNFLLDESPLPEFRACEQVIAPMIGNVTAKKSAVRKIPKTTILAAIKDKIDYDGEHFLAKPARLYRINLSSLNSSGHLVRSTNVRIRGYGSVQRAKVRVRNQRRPSRLTLDLVQARLQAEIKVVKADQKILKLETRQEMNLTVTTVHEQTQAINATLAAAQERLRAELRDLTSRREQLGNQFNNWPEHCRVPNHLCDTSASYGSSHSTASTFGACDRACHSDPRCQSFAYHRAGGGGCYHYDFVCSWDKFKSNSGHDYFVKLSRVPIMTTQMWASLLLNGTVGDISSDPCQMIGEKFTFSRYP